MGSPWSRQEFGPFELSLCISSTHLSLLVEPAGRESDGSPPRSPGRRVLALMAGGIQVGEECPQLLGAARLVFVLAQEPEKRAIHRLRRTDRAPTPGAGTSGYWAGDGGPVSGAATR